MTQTLIRNATVLPCTVQPNGQIDVTPTASDVLIEGDRIVQVAPHIDSPTATVINADHHLLMPGFVDGHTHSTIGVLERCGYEALPLELWMLYLPPDQPLEPRFHYLCAAIAGLEALKNGTTTIQDDIYAFPHITPDTFGAVAQAYTDLGMRASLSVHAINKPLHKTIPFLDSYLTDDLRSTLEQPFWMADDDWIALFRSLHQRWHGHAGRITTILAPSGPQRVTPDLLHRIGELSEELDVPIHTHIVETRTQAVTGPEFFGESLVSYAKRHGILTHRTAIAHGIWLTPDDIELLAEANASIVHNVVSNHRLCSGIARIRELLAAGVNVGVGSDGMDSFNLFNTLRMAGMVHSVTDAKFERYPKAVDVLKWATYGSARSALLHEQVGSIQPGMKADLVLYDLNTVAFTPAYDLPISLVYAEGGQSIRKVFVNGELVVEDGRVLTINEAELLAEFRDRMAAYLPHREQWHQRSAELRPAMEQTYWHAMNQSLPIENFSRATLTD